MRKNVLPGQWATLLLATLCTITLLFPVNTNASGSFFLPPVTGVIRDAATGNALAGASVEVKGTNVRTSTDGQGAFSIEVPASNSVLVITYVGYETQEIVVGNRSQFQISLQSNSAELTQVVVVGYGTQNKKDITGA